MNILILENSPKRIAWFREHFAGETLMITSSPDVAIELLTLTEFDRIYLDHDLLDWHLTCDATCDKTTGLAVAKFLAESKASPESIITIHSLHRAGAERMRQALWEANRNCLLTPIDKLSNNKVRS